MANNEHIPDRDIDLYVNPRLSPNPAWHPELLATRVALKRAAIRNSMKVFGRLQAEAAARRTAERKKQEEERQLAWAAAKAERDKKPCHEDNESGFGLLVKKGEEPIAVRHTAANNKFFKHNPEEDRFELSYDGSADIVTFLRTLPEQESYDEPSGEQKLAFFDTQGAFYDQMLLESLFPPDRGPGHRVKHTAIFRPADSTQGYPVAVRIDDIYCLDFAEPPTA